jgi:hypothetical protein
VQGRVLAAALADPAWAPRIREHLYREGEVAIPAGLPHIVVGEAADDEESIHFDL